MNEKELKEELRDIRNLLVAQLLVSGVQISEIEEILELGEGNFNKAYNARKLIKRMKKKSAGGKNGKKEN